MKLLKPLPFNIKSNKLCIIMIDNRITIDPNICNGKPTIRHKRITVQTILEFLSNGDSVADILEQYPTLNEEDIYACLKFATNLVEHNYIIEPIAA